MNTADTRVVTAVIVNYQSALDTGALVNNIKFRDIDQKVNNIIVVDNSGELPSDEPPFDNVQLLKPQVNIGYGAAVNLAAKQTDNRWLLILNPDIKLQKNSLENLLDAAQTLNTPLCGPRFYWDDECRFQLPPALGHPLWLLSDRHMPDRNLSEAANLSALSITRHERFWGEQAPFSEAVLSGACLLVDLDWFNKNNMPIFDEAFFLYYEDTDLCGRLMRKGIMPVCVPDAAVVHYWNQSGEPPEGKAELMAKSEKIFLDRYYPNGAPPLPAGTHSERQNNLNDLGKASNPTAFTLPEDTVLLDVGVQLDFLVFARTRLDKTSFSFPEAMWQRMRDGHYYLRVGNSGGRFMQYWHFEKVSPQGNKTNE